MSQKFAKTIKTYNDYAAKFAAHFERKLDTFELDKFIKLIPEAGKVLDAGCGSARDAAYMIKSGRAAVGIDLSAGLLIEAKKLHPEVPTFQMSLADFSFSDESFDGIWCKAALLHLERSEIPQVINNFFQALKPNGILYIQTKSGEGEGAQVAPFDLTVERHFTFFSSRELMDLLTKAGFEILDNYDFNGLKRSPDSRNQDWLVIFAKKKSI